MKNENVYNKKSIKNLPEMERPYERIEAIGAESLTDAELISVIIKSGTVKETSVDVARNLIELCGDKGLNNLYNMSIDELISINGIGKVKAIQIKALCEICIRMSATKNNVQKKKINNVSDVAEMLMERMSSFNKENFKIILMDRKWHVIKISDVSVGCLDQAIVHPREVFWEAIKNSCACVVLAHNHPSGDTNPSEEDIRTTSRLYLAGDIIGIEVVDHIIIGNGTFYSMHLSGIMREIKNKANRWQDGVFHT